MLSNREILVGASFLILNLHPFLFFCQSLYKSQNLMYLRKEFFWAGDIVVVPQTSGCWLFCLSCSRQSWAEVRRQPGKQRRPRPPGLLFGPPVFEWTSVVLCGERDTHTEVHTFLRSVSLTSVLLSTHDHFANQHSHTRVRVLQKIKSLSTRLPLNSNSLL